MKKIFALGLIAVVSIFGITLALADVGEEEPSNVAPAIIQAPQEPVAPQAEPAAPRQVAQTGTRTIRETDLRTEDQQSVAGSVVCTTPSGLMSPRARLVIAEQGGAEVEFTVKTLAVIYDAAGNIMPFNCLQQGDKVRVTYRILAGDCKEATAIKILK